MKKTGVTGGIASGKSYVANIFVHLGIPVYNTDREAKRLMVESSDLIRDIKLFLGEEAYQGSVLNRQYIADKVFADKGLLTKLNDIVHPVVHRDFDIWAEQQEAPFVLKESALLLQSLDHGLDAIILVDASAVVRKQRVLSRDKFRSEEQVDNIIAQQGDWDELKNKADYIIDNNGSEMLLPQVVAVYDLLLKL